MSRVPSRSWFDPVLGAYLHTGDRAVEVAAGLDRPRPVSIDIETPGLDRALTINCVTAAWIDSSGDCQAVLLDPLRAPGMHRAALRRIIDRANSLILHNACFDVPALYHHDLLSDADIGRITDTLVLARIAYPDTIVSKSLSALAVRHLDLPNFAEGMKLAFKAAGHRTIAAGYENMDIDSPAYRLGALADTVATLRLEPILRAKALAWTLDHPFGDHAACSPDDASGVIAAQERVNRVMLRRTAHGINVDRDYLSRYAEQVDIDRQRSAGILAAAGLEGGSGKGAALVTYLDAIGELPPGWPTTPTGKLKSAKADLDRLDHPLASAQRRLAEIDKVMGYLDKVSLQADVTGRCHPQVGILGASATGRWSVSSPEYQQFPASARPIFVSDAADADRHHAVADVGGKPEHRAVGDGQQLWSIDFSQIEPVIMGNLAGGTDSIITAYEAGNDLYEPLTRAAGIDRTLAKTMLLAMMYGQGVKSLAARIGHSVESASQIRRQVFAAMPAAERFMARVAQIGADYGRTLTVGGRILPVDPDGVFRATNHCIQGSAADQLVYAVDVIEAAGLGDRIVMGLHDELVVDCDADTAATIERLMAIPHPNITRWTGGRVPVLRTDRVPMGAAWAKV